MSKQSELKLLMDYKEKPVFPICSNCKHYQSEMITTNNFGKDWVQEKNIRCELGGFAIKKQATCNKHQFKPA